MTHREVKGQIAAAAAAGTLAADAAVRAATLVDSAYAKYLQREFRAAIVDIDALRQLASTTSSGAAPPRTALVAKAQ